MIKQDYRLTIWETGYKFFKYENKLHRLDGPAAIRGCGNGIEDYYVHGCYYCVDGHFISAANFYENYCKKHD